MENKINIAELLKDCPKGMELYSTIYGTVYFKGVRDTGNAVLIDVKTSCNTEAQFYPDGKFNTYYSDSEMTLFPSKDVRTWEGFVPPCKFKVGDKIVHKVNKESPFTITEITNDCYKGGTQYEVLIEQQDNFELVAPDKFNINTLTPFESRVLVRDYRDDRWRASFWGCLINSEYNLIYDTTRGCYKQCIPYEGNEHLLGKTNDCDNFYKTWE